MEKVLNGAELWARRGKAKEEDAGVKRSAEEEEEEGPVRLTTWEETPENQRRLQEARTALSQQFSAPRLASRSVLSSATLHSPLRVTAILKGRVAASFGSPLPALQHDVGHHSQLTSEETYFLLDTARLQLRTPTGLLLSLAEAHTALFPPDCGTPFHHYLVYARLAHFGYRVRPHSDHHRSQRKIDPDNVPEETTATSYPAEPPAALALASGGQPERREKKERVPLTTQVGVSFPDDRGSGRLELEAASASFLPVKPSQERSSPRVIDRRFGFIYILQELLKLILGAFEGIYMGGRRWMGRLGCEVVSSCDQLAGAIRRLSSDPPPPGHLSRRLNSSGPSPTIHPRPTSSPEPTQLQAAALIANFSKPFVCLPRMLICGCSCPPFLPKLFRNCPENCAGTLASSRPGKLKWCTMCSYRAM